VNPLSQRDLTRLDDLLQSNLTLLEALPRCVGFTEAADGIWRFFSDSWPNNGVVGWNDGRTWKGQWAQFLPPQFFSFGEDVFGNQLALVSTCENVVLMNHENAELHDLLLGPYHLLNTVLENGVDWIDFYSDGSLDVARAHGPVSLDVHLHWTTPLILGGQIDSANLSAVERKQHLIGHAKLWAQIADLPPGSVVVPRS
jgi:hypothetical protein